MTHHVSSAWTLTWRGDHQMVVARMTPANRAVWREGGFATVRSRSVFMGAALALDLKVIYATYVMEQAHLNGLAGEGISLAEWAA